MSPRSAGRRAARYSFDRNGIRYRPIPRSTRRGPPCIGPRTVRGTRRNCRGQRHRARRRPHSLPLRALVLAARLRGLLRMLPARLRVARAPSPTSPPGGSARVVQPPFPPPPPSHMRQTPAAARAPSLVPLRHAGAHTSASGHNRSSAAKPSITAPLISLSQRPWCSLRRRWASVDTATPTISASSAT